MIQNLEEIWRPIEGYPDYEVSSFGRVRNKETGKYSKITLYGNYNRASCVFQRKRFHINRLVAKAFPEICGIWFNKCQVHHLDKNPENNRADNLVVCTKEEHYTYHRDDRVEAGKKRTGLNNPMFGMHHSEETRRKMSESRKGKNNPNYGKPRLEETRRKISMSRKDKKPLYQYTLDGKFIREWESLKKIEYQLGYSDSNISKCCKGKSNTAYGYKWKFKSDVQNSK